MKESKKISLWSGPRNISTALMYSFAQRADTTVIDEPLYAHYLDKTKAHEYHPGADLILREMNKDGLNVMHQLINMQEKPVYFFKNMTHHLLGINRSLLKSMTNLILTRDPEEMLPSFHKVIPNPDMKDVGYEAQTNLLKELKKLAIPVIVIDSKRVLINPEEQLTKVCSFADIPFDRSMLQWPAGKRKEDGSWAKYWYQSVHRSTTFAKYTPKKEAFPHELKPLLKECKPHYEALLEHAI